jgi:hypothetical protein
MDYFILVGSLLPVIVVGAIATAAYLGWKRRLAKYSHVVSGNGYRLRFCSEARFKKWLKFFPWQGVAVMDLQDGVATVKAYPDKGEPFVFSAPASEIYYVGYTQWLRNGLLPWILIRTLEGSYFLCVETGVTIFGAKEETRRIVDKITQEAQQAAAGQPATTPRVGA